MFFFDFLGRSNHIILWFIFERIIESNKNEKQDNKDTKLVIFDQNDVYKIIQMIYYIKMNQIKKVFFIINMNLIIMKKGK